MHGLWPTIPIGAKFSSDPILRNLKKHIHIKFRDGVRDISMIGYSTPQYGLKQSRSLLESPRFPMNRTMQLLLRISVLWTKKNHGYRLIKSEIMPVMVTYLGVMWQKTQDPNTRNSVSSDDGRLATCARGPIEDHKFCLSALQGAEEVDIVDPRIVVDDETNGFGDAGREWQTTLHLISGDLARLHGSLTQVGWALPFC